MKIVAIVGSPRPAGNTNYLVDQALDEAKTNGCEVEKIILRQHKIEGCRGHDRCATYEKCKIDDDIPMILEKFRTADGTILATPVYYYNMTAQMKTFIDRNYFLYTHGLKLQSRCMGLIIVAGGSGNDITIRALRRCFGLQGANRDNWLVVSGYASRVGDMQHNAPLIAEARQMGKRMAEILGRG